MTQKEILKNNKMIAKFMGFTFHKDNSINSYPKEYYHTVGYQCKFYSKTIINSFSENWDWLMPVIDKICELLETDNTYPNFNVGSKYTYFYHDDNTWKATHLDFVGGVPKFKTKLLATYYVICEFIKWYNKQSK